MLQPEPARRLKCLGLSRPGVVQLLNIHVCVISSSLCQCNVYHSHRFTDWLVLQRDQTTFCFVTLIQTTSTILVSVATIIVACPEFCLWYLLTLTCDRLTTKAYHFVYYTTYHYFVVELKPKWPQPLTCWPKSITARYPCYEHRSYKFELYMSFHFWHTSPNSTHILTLTFDLLNLK